MCSGPVWVCGVRCGCWFPRASSDAPHSVCQCHRCVNKYIALIIKNAIAFVCSFCALDLNQQKLHHIPHCMRRTTCAPVNPFRLAILIWYRYYPQLILCHVEHESWKFRLFLKNLFRLLFMRAGWVLAHTHMSVHACEQRCHYIHHFVGFRGGNNAQKNEKWELLVGVANRLGYARRVLHHFFKQTDLQFNGKL